MPDNDFWIGQEQIPVDLSLLLTYLASEAHDAKAARTALDDQSGTKDAPTRSEQADTSL